MDKRLNKKLEGWITEFKDDIINEICKLEFQNNDQTNKLRQFVYDHSRLLFT